MCGLYAGTRSTDMDAKLAGADPARSRSERCQELGSAQSQLLGDDRRISLDIQRESLETDDSTGACGRRHALRNERLERRDRP